MGTPLYNTDIIPLTSRPTLTVMDDGDFFVILDTSTGKISKILKTNIMTALKITYDNTSGLTAETVQAALDELVVNLGSTNTVIESLKGVGWTDENLVDHEERLDTLEGTGEGSVAKAIDDALEPIEEDITDHESRIVVLENWTRVKSWLDVQEVVRAGRAEAYFPVGLQFTADWNGVPRTLDVIGYHDIPTNTDFTHALTLQFHDILRTGMISAPEAMYNAVTALPAGTYIFTTNSLQYTFTSTQAVPTGGVIFIKTRNEYAPLTLTIYGADRTSIIEDDIAVTTTSGTDNLSPINDHARMRYGNNNYEISALRQWLNSDSAAFAWQPLGLYDMPSSYSTQGFLNILDPDLKAVIGAVDKQVAKPDYDGGEQTLFSDKVFLLSRVEMGLGTEGVTTGEAVYDFWSGASDADRLKGSPSYWWLRSPNVSATHFTRRVNTSGALGTYYANYGYGLAPACVII